MARTRPAYKPGDIVTLKSGGPPMTINCTFDDDAFQVVWHTTDGTMQREGLFPDAVEPYRPED